MTDAQEKLNRRAQRAVAAELECHRLDEDTTEAQVRMIAGKLIDALLASGLTITEA